MRQSVQLGLRLVRYAHWLKNPRAGRPGPLCNNLQDLFAGALRLLRCTTPTLPSRQLTVSERNAPIALADHFQRCRLAGRAEVETRLRGNIRVSPAVEYDSRDVPS